MLGGIAVILIVGAVIGGVALSRRRARLAAENDERRRLLAEAAAEQQHRAGPPGAAAEAPTVYLGQYQWPDEPLSPPGYRLDAHGLLSGREDASDPGLLSGQDYVPPLPEERTTLIPPVPGKAADEEGRTERLTDRTRRRHAAAEPDVAPGSDPAVGSDPAGGSDPAAGSHPAAGSDRGGATRAWTPIDDEDDDEPPPRGRHGL